MGELPKNYNPVEGTKMAKLTNESVIVHFLGFEAGESHTGNLYTSNSGKDFKLMNYGTCLAQFIGGKLVVNATKYSVTTSKIQSKLRYHAPFYIETTKHVPMGTRDLSGYVNLEVNS
jgi:hypothetical protein